MIDTFSNSGLTFAGLGLLPVPAAQVELLSSSASHLELRTPRPAWQEKPELWNPSVEYRTKREKGCGRKANAGCIILYFVIHPEMHMISEL